jgi:pre-mRNA-splicing factor ATP-dependent RNA helicase DHX16
MPYDPDALLSARIRDACKDGRLEEIRRLSALWFVADENEESLKNKIEELFWVSTLLLAGCGKPGRKPRLDFFLMHILNATLFLPSLAAIIRTKESKVKLFRAFLPTLLMYLIIRGRPRIDAELVMTYTAVPLPPDIPIVKPDSSALGDPNDPDSINPWPAILASVIHAPEAHIVKAIRALYYAAQKYGHTAAGDVPGALKGAEETHKGIAKVDGTVFIRAAGVAMNTLGWVTHGQREGEWDRSALGWDDAWKGDD